MVSGFFTPLACTPRVLFVRTALRPADVDPELLGRAEHVLVEVAHLDLLSRRGQHLDVQAQALHFLDENFEALRYPGFGYVVALYDRLVDLDPAKNVVGLDREQFLERVRRAISLEGPDFHFTEALTTELRFTTERLLGDHRVRASGPGVDLVVHEVGQFQYVYVADRNRVVVRLAAAPVVKDRFAVGPDQATVVPVLGAG